MIFFPRKECKSCADQNSPWLYFHLDMSLVEIVYAIKVDQVWYMCEASLDCTMKSYLERSWKFVSGKSKLILKDFTSLQFMPESGLLKFLYDFH